MNIMNTRDFVAAALVALVSGCATVRSSAALVVDPSAPRQGAEVADVLRTLADLNARSGTKRESPNMVSTIDAVRGPFSPENNRCSLPDKLIKKVKKDPNWVPQGLAQLARRIPAKEVAHVEQADVKVILHTVTYKENPTDATKPPVELVITGSSTYLALDPMPFIDTNKPHFLYSLDCSGYLNAAVSVSAGLTSAQIKSGAKTALTSKSSAFVARASLFPPVAVAMDPKNTPSSIETRVSSRLRIDLLYAIFAALPSNAADTGEISAPRRIDVLWSSNSGSQTFQGEADFSASGSGSIGVVGIEGGASAGLSLARKSEFVDYDTYLIEASSLPARPLAVSELRARITREVGEAHPVGAVTLIDNDYVFGLDLPRKLCESTRWTVASFSTGKPPAGGSLLAKYSELDGCRFRLSGAALQQIAADGGIGLNGQDGTLSYSRQVRLR
jgi:hypothetical protein